MFDVFDDMFDLDNSGHIDPSEQTLEFMVIDDMMNEDSESKDGED